MLGRKSIVVAASVATLMSAAVVTAPLADAKPKAKAPAKVAKARQTAASTNAVAITWANPKAKNFKATVVRVAAGTKAPKSVKAGRGIATVAKKRHAVTITRLAAGTVYTVSLFSSDGKKHFSKPVALRIRTATPPKKSTPAPPTTGTISGTVFGGSSSTRLGNVLVSATPDTGKTTLHAVTRSDGSYSFTDVAPDSYQVCFDPDEATGGSSATGYKFFCFDDAIAIVGGTLASNRNAILSRITRLAGEVTAQIGGAKLSNVDVELHDVDGNFVDDTSTNDDGTYEFLDVSTRAAEVCFSADDSSGGSSTTGYLDECSAKFTLAAGDDKTVNAAMKPGGAVSGTVLGKRANGSTVALDDAQVYAIDVNNGNSRRGTANPSGSYSVGGLATGDYYVCVNTEDVDLNAAGASTGFIQACLGATGSRWTGGTDDIPPGAATLHVTSGQAANANGSVTLESGGAFHGTVTGADGTTGVSAQVFVYSGDDMISSSYTSSVGTYRLAGLPTGSYSVCFSPDTDGDQSGLGYLSQCYKNVAWNGSDEIPSGLTTKVPVTVKQDYATSIDANLAPAGAISGKVTGGGNGVDFRIRVFDQNDNQVATSYISGSSDGTYTFGGLATGTYHVCFASRDDSYGSQCYKNLPYDEDSDSLPTGLTDVSVTSGSTEPNVDAVLPKI